MVKVCEDEDKDDEDAKRELQELLGLATQAKRPPQAAPPKPKSAAAPARPQASKPVQISQPSKPPKSNPSKQQQPLKVSESKKGEEISTAGESSVYNSTKKSSARNIGGTCPICSVENELTALTCMVCSNVLKPGFVPNSWQCKSSACKDSDYVNAGDVGICGVCGTRKCSNNGI